jgi:hypothetical protein
LTSFWLFGYKRVSPPTAVAYEKEIRFTNTINASLEECNFARHNRLSAFNARRLWGVHELDGWYWQLVR